MTKRKRSWSASNAFSPALINRILTDRSTLNPDILIHRLILAVVSLASIQPPAEDGYLPSALANTTYTDSAKHFDFTSSNIHGGVNIYNGRYVSSIERVTAH